MNTSESRAAVEAIQKTGPGDPIKFVLQTRFKVQVST